MLLDENTIEAPDNLNQNDVDPGKLPTRPKLSELNSLSAAQIHTVSLLHIRDVLSGNFFLVDTGAEVSIVPPAQPDLSKPPGLNLIVANGSKIKSFGTRRMTLQIDHAKYDWKFQITDVQKLILGAISSTPTVSWSTSQARGSSATIPASVESSRMSRLALATSVPPEMEMPALHTAGQPTTVLVPCRTNPNIGDKPNNTSWSSLNATHTGRFVK